MSNTRKPARETDAREAEARDEKTVTFEWRGQTFTVSRNYDDMTVDFIESVEEGKTVGIVRGALGVTQWRAVRVMGLKMRDLRELADLIAVAMGFADAGESVASSD